MNTFGTIFRVSLFGESHGPSIGVVLDGVPAGIPLVQEDFIEDLRRRRPGSGHPGVSQRKEADEPQILSGVNDGATTGAPLCIVFANEDARPSDYSLFESVPRPGHADFTASVKFNYFNDIRGGGHFSGRLTLALVAAGVVAKKVIYSLTDGRCVCRAEVISIGGFTQKDSMDAFIKECMEQGDSAGGIVECRVSGMPVGAGEPFFDSLESLISHAAFAVPGIRGIEFGDGFRAASMKGSQHNDPFADSLGRTLRNGSGGINGGISNGNDLVFRVAVKPASSIAAEQTTYDFVNECMTTLKIPGRHDVCIALRAPAVIEAVAAMTLADAFLRMK